MGAAAWWGSAFPQLDGPCGVRGSGPAPAQGTTFPPLLRQASGRVGVEQRPSGLARSLANNGLHVPAVVLGEGQPPRRALAELVPDQVGAALALALDHVQVMVLRLPTKRGDDPHAPDEEAGEDLEADEQRQPTFAPLPHARQAMDRS